tara:strand:- start:6762 stop:7028 length:267 start_codon:yes stop_codon:yes gene_type:complete
MQNSFLANVDGKNVGQGMMKVVDTLQSFSKAEKYVILCSVFNCMYNNKLRKDRTIAELMNIVDRIRVDCKNKKIPEFGGAENFIKGEL